MAGCQIILIDLNFYLQKCLEIFDKNSADKIQSKNYKEGKSALPHAGLMAKFFLRFAKEYCSVRTKKLQSLKVIFFFNCDLFTALNENEIGKLNQIAFKFEIPKTIIFTYLN